MRVCLSFAEEQEWQGNNKIVNCTANEHYTAKEQNKQKSKIAKIAKEQKSKKSKVLNMDIAKEQK